jgi:(S)-ureidoglycine aminohydrolase
MPFASLSLISVKKTKTKKEKKSRGVEERIIIGRGFHRRRRKPSGNIVVALFSFCFVLHALLEFARSCLHPTLAFEENAMTTKSPYHGVSSDASKYTSLLFENVPGFTRSKLKPDYAMIAHESRVYGGLFGWQNTLGAYVVSPGMNKATILMTMVSMSANGKSHLPSPGAWRFAFVLDGACSIRYKDEDANAYVTKEGLRAGEYFYFPMNVEHEIYTDEKNQCELVMYEAFTKPKLNGKSDEFPTGQKVIVGETDSLPNIETPGEIFRLKKLLPQTLEYDVNFHVMDFAPGETLNVKELHHPQHGLVILEGQGIYRLNDDFMPVQQGDVIYMSPWVTQWYGALGKNRTRYLISKDTFRDPLRDSNP